MENDTTFKKISISTTKVTTLIKTSKIYHFLYIKLFYFSFLNS